MGYFLRMAKHIRVLEHGNQTTRITIPRDLARARGFLCDKYIIIDDELPDVLILRRFDFAETKGGDSPAAPARKNR